MSNEYTHIHILLDRTGSMEIIRDDTIGGFNAFLKEQKALPGKATMTLVQFDSQAPYEVIHDFKPIDEVAELTRETFVPRASTPLLDAMGRAINDLDAKISSIAEIPNRVVMVIITDGQENASREFHKNLVEEMIKQKQASADWQFVFLSADLASIDDAAALGFKQASTMAYDQEKAGVRSMYTSASDSISRYRKGEKSVSFSEEDRAKQKSERKRKE